MQSLLREKAVIRRPLRGHLTNPSPPRQPNITNDEDPNSKVKDAPIKVILSLFGILIVVFIMFSVFQPKSNRPANHPPLIVYPPNSKSTPKNSPLDNSPLSKDKPHQPALLNPNVINKLNPPKSPSADTNKEIKVNIEKFDDNPKEPKEEQEEEPQEPPEPEDEAAEEEPDAEEPNDELVLKLIDNDIYKL